jgi:hypothetical protein
MRVVRLVAASAIAAAAGSVVTVAQAPDRPLTALEIAVSCAPPTSFDMPPGKTLHVLGAQDTVPRMMFDRGALLVLDGGTSGGVQLGQRYYIRRLIAFGTDRHRAEGVLTLGWLRIVALNETTAIASVDHACAAIATGDYLEPYALPALPANADRDEVSGELDFTSLGRVLFGPENHAAAGRGDLMLIDRGVDQGVKAGAHFAVYRDIRMGGMPLSAVGEAVVLSAGKAMSLARIMRSRDAVVTGDYVVPRK